MRWPRNMVQLERMKRQLRLLALQLQRRQGKLLPALPLHGEAEHDVVGSEDAPVLEDDGFGPPPKEPKGLAEPLHPGGCPLEDPTSASNPGPKQQRTQFAVAIEGPNTECLSEVQEDTNVIMRHKAFKHIAQEEPLPITKDAACGIQAPIKVVIALQPWTRTGHTCAGSISFGWTS